MAIANGFAPIVQAVVAEMSPSHSMLDIEVTDTLENLGISPDLVPELAIRLYRTVGGSISGDYRDFAKLLSIGSDSSIAEVAAHFDRASFGSAEASVAASGGVKEPAEVVETAVRTAIAAVSRTHSISEIRPTHTLRALSLEDVDITDVKTRVYRMLSGGRAHPSFSGYFKDARIGGATTVADAAEILRKAFLPAVRRGAAE